jgi:iron(III) transport system ATP-binding protein
MSVALSLENVSFGYGRQMILDGFSFAVRPGEITVMLGPSGGGKTSVLRLLLGLAVPQRGRVLFDNDSVSAPGLILVAPENRGIAVVFQDLALWPHLTVRGNLAFVLASRKIPREQHAARTERILRRVGLRGKEDRYPGELSGGERQRVAIARALVYEPRAILLDEPLANLDAHLKRELLRVFRELIAERALTALYVTHDAREAAALGDSIAVLEGGRITKQGSLAEMGGRPSSEFMQAILEDLVPSGRPRGQSPAPQRSD